MRPAEPVVHAASARPTAAAAEAESLPAVVASHAYVLACTSATSGIAQLGSRANAASGSEAARAGREQAHAIAAMKSPQARGQGKRWQRDNGRIMRDSAGRGVQEAADVRGLPS